MSIKKSALLLLILSIFILSPVSALIIDNSLIDSDYDYNMKMEIVNTWEYDINHYIGVPIEFRPYASVGNIKIYQDIEYIANEINFDVNCGSAPYESCNDTFWNSTDIYSASIGYTNPYYTGSGDCTDLRGCYVDDSNTGSVDSDIAWIRTNILGKSLSGIDFPVQDGGATTKLVGDKFVYEGKNYFFRIYNDTVDGDYDVIIQRGTVVDYWDNVTLIHQYTQNGVNPSALCTSPVYASQNQAKFYYNLTTCGSSVAVYNSVLIFEANDGTIILATRLGHYSTNGGFGHSQYGSSVSVYSYEQDYELGHYTLYFDQYAWHSTNAVKSHAFTYNGLISTNDTAYMDSTVTIWDSDSYSSSFTGTHDFDDNVWDLLEQTARKFVGTEYKVEQGSDGRSNLQFYPKLSNVNDYHSVGIPSCEEILYYFEDATLLYSDEDLGLWRRFCTNNETIISRTPVTTYIDDIVYYNSSQVKNATIIWNAGIDLNDKQSYQIYWSPDNDTFSSMTTHIYSFETAEIVDVPDSNSIYKNFVSGDKWRTIAEDIAFISCYILSGLGLWADPVELCPGERYYSGNIYYPEMYGDLNIYTIDRDLIISGQLGVGSSFIAEVVGQSYGLYTFLLKYNDKISNIGSTVGYYVDANATGIGYRVISDYSGVTNTLEIDLLDTWGRVLDTEFLIYNDIDCLTPEIEGSGGILWKSINDTVYTRIACNQQNRLFWVRLYYDIPKFLGSNWFFVPMLLNTSTTCTSCPSGYYWATGNYTIRNDYYFGKFYGGFSDYVTGVTWDTQIGTIANENFNITEMNFYHGETRELLNLTADPIIPSEKFFIECVVPTGTAPTVVLEIYQNNDTTGVSTTVVKTQLRVDGEGKALWTINDRIFQADNPLEIFSEYVYANYWMINQYLFDNGYFSYVIPQGNFTATCYINENPNSTLSDDFEYLFDYDQIGATCVKRDDSCKIEGRVEDLPPCCLSGCVDGWRDGCTSCKEVGADDWRCVSNLDYFKRIFGEPCESDDDCEPFHTTGEPLYCYVTDKENNINLCLTDAYYNSGVTAVQTWLNNLFKGMEDIWNDFIIWIGVILAAIVVYFLYRLSGKDE